MIDKDLLVVISEMLRKQDQHSELLSKQTEMINLQTQSLEKIGSSLNNFIEISINQFEQQQKFNDKFLEKIDVFGKMIENTTNLDERIKKLESTVFKP